MRIGIDRQRDAHLGCPAHVHLIQIQPVNPGIDFECSVMLARG
jgi:hypothetical protein